MEATQAVHVLASVVPPSSRPGPRPGYNIGHAMMAVLHFSEMKRLSREDLSRLLGVTEGTAKTLIAYMQLAHVVVTSSGGTSLSGFGSEIASAVRSIVASWTEVRMFYLATDRHAVAFKLGPSELRSVSPLQLRDRVVRYGGAGSTVVNFSRGRFSIPLVSDDLALSSRDDAEELRRLGPREGDVLVIVSSRSVPLACTSFAAAAADLLSEPVEGTGRSASRAEA